MSALYIPPVDAWVSSDWQNHKDRKPPSVQPGTDYACAYGSNLVTPARCVVTHVDRDPNQGEGRVVTVNPIGSRHHISFLHLSDKIWVRVGQILDQGVVFGQSGASGFGKDWYYGPHVHVTLWDGKPWQSWTLDFEKYLASTAGGGGVPFNPTTPSSDSEDEEEAEMALHGAAYTRGSDKAVVFLLFNEVSGFWQEHSGVPGAYNNALARNWGTGSWPTITEAHARVIKNACDKVRVNSTTVSGALKVEGLEVQADLAVDVAALSDAINDEDDRREQAERDLLNRGA